jgi:hypothetical protein
MHQRSQYKRKTQGRKQTTSSNLTRRNRSAFNAVVESVNSGKVRITGGKYYPLQRKAGLRMEDIFPGASVHVVGHKIVKINHKENARDGYTIGQQGGWF